MNKPILYVCNKKKCKECISICNYTSLKEFAFVDIPVEEVPDNTIFDGMYILRNNYSKNIRDKYKPTRKKNRHYNERVK